jgi:hypothetical protein
VQDHRDADVLFLAFISTSAVAAGNIRLNRPVCVPFPPGGNDVVGRLIAAKLTERLKAGVHRQPGGAGGVLVRNRVKSRSDGYTLLIIAADMLLVLRSINHYVSEVLRPIARLANGSIVRPFTRTFGKFVKELIELPSRSRPDTVQFGVAQSTFGKRPFRMKVIVSR